MLNNIIGFIASKFADKAINAGIDAVIGDDSGGGGGNIVTPPNFDAARILASSPAGVGDLTFGKLEFEEDSYEENLNAWEKRLTEYAESRPVVSRMEI